MRSSRARGLNQVQLAAPWIGEDGDSPVGFPPRRLQKRNAARLKVCVVAVEIVGLEEVPDAPAGALTDRRELARAFGFGEHQPRAGRPAGGDDHPALAVAQGDVLDEVEAERVAKPGNRHVVVGHEKGDGGETAGQGEIPYRLI